MGGAYASVEKLNNYQINVAFFKTSKTERERERERERGEREGEGERERVLPFLATTDKSRLATSRLAYNTLRVTEHFMFLK